MSNSKRIKVFFTLALALVLLLATMGLLDSFGSAYNETALDQAAVAYAVTRGINAIISVAQGTKLDLAVLNFSIGEILDPINDLVERFSWIVLAAMASLGIQKVLILLAAAPFFNLVLWGVGLILAGLVWFYAGFTRQIRYCTYLLLILLFVRFSFVGVALVNYCLENGILHEIKADAMEELKQTQSNLSQLAGNSEQEEALLASVKSAWSSLLSEQQDEPNVNQMREIAEKTIDSIIDLIVVFTLQTLILPLLFLWGWYIALVQLIKKTGQSKPLRD